MRVYCLFHTHWNSYFKSTELYLGHWCISVTYKQCQEHSTSSLTVFWKGDRGWEERKRKQVFRKAEDKAPHIQTLTLYAKCLAQGLAQRLFLFPLSCLSLQKSSASRIRVAFARATEGHRWRIHHMDSIWRHHHLPGPLVTTKGGLICDMRLVRETG